MPHQCVRCGTFYEDTAHEILRGCKCGGRLFFFVKKDLLNEIKEKTSQLTSEQKTEIEDEVFELIRDEVDKEETVVLDIESVRILQQGKYEIDLVNLFRKQPLIYKVGEGKYIIDLVQTFKNIQNGKEREKHKHH